MKQYLKLLLLIIFIMVVSFIVYRYRATFNINNIQIWLNNYQPWTPLVFILLYVLATIFFLPGTVMTISGGLLFGLWWGTLYNIIGATIGASFALLIGRYLASDWVANKGGKYVNRVLNGVEHEGWRFVAFVRFVPLFPFNLVNYLFGLTRIKLIPYALVSFICMLPGAFAYTYIGALGDDFINSDSRKLIGRIFIGIGLIILVSILPIFIKRYRNRHKKQPYK